MNGYTDRSLIKTLWRGILSLIFPSHCARCGTPLAASRDLSLCENCWNAFQRIRQPFCPTCGKPVVSGAVVPFDTPCGECRLSKRSFCICRSAGVYEGALKECIHLFKYKGMPEFARTLAVFMAEFAPSGFAEMDYDGLIPVPLHHSKLRERGYNQALLLAQELGARLSIPVREHLLGRIERRNAQSTLKRAERLKNIRGVFALGVGKNVRGLRLLLIDDVLTTGATAEECVRVLLKGGAGRVDVFTAARGI